MRGIMKRSVRVRQSNVVVLRWTNPFKLKVCLLKTGRVSDRTTAPNQTRSFLFTVNEFIHDNKNISVYLDKSFLLNFYKKTGWSFVFGPEGKTQVVEVERFFGVRLDSINMNGGQFIF